MYTKENKRHQIYIKRKEIKEEKRKEGKNIDQIRSCAKYTRTPSRAHHLP